MKLSKKTKLLSITFLILLTVCVLLIAIGYIVKMYGNGKNANMGAMVIIYQENRYFYDGITSVENPEAYLAEYEKLETADFSYSNVPETALQSVYYDSARNVFYSWPTVFSSNGEAAINVFRVRDN